MESKSKTSRVQETRTYCRWPDLQTIATERKAIEYCLALRTTSL